MILNMIYKHFLPQIYGELEANDLSFYLKRCTDAKMLKHLGFSFIRKNVVGRSPIKYLM